MTVSVPESIRATAIEAGARTFPGWNEDTEDGDLTAHWEKVNQTCREQAAEIVDAILPAVVAQVQADAWDEGYEAADSNTPRSRKGHWESDDPRATRSVRTWVPDPLPLNPYREKGDSDYMPTTLDIQRGWSAMYEEGTPRADRIRQFYRWLASHDAKVRAEQREADAKIAESWGREHEEGGYARSAFTVARAIRAVPANTNTEESN